MTSPIVCKADVKFGGFAPAAVRILLGLSRLSDRYIVMITSGSEGTHDPNSWHYRFGAIDTKTKHFSDPQKHAFLVDLRKELGPDFTVMLESEGQPNEHAHIQPVKGTVYGVEKLKGKV